MRRLILCSVLLAAACSSASGAATRSYPVGAFSSVRSAGPWIVRVHTGAAPSATASGDATMLDRLSVAVANGELVIDSKSGWRDMWNWGSRGPVTIDVTVPSLRSATLSGSGKVNVDRVASPTFEARLTGSGDLSIGAIDAQEIRLNLTGSGDLTAAGRVRALSIASTGSGDLHAAGLAAQDVDVRLVGSGDVAAAAARTATINLLGSGDVTIAGKARCTISKRGSGEIRCG